MVASVVNTTQIFTMKLWNRRMDLDGDKEEVSPS
jgi:hypothetical protein